MSWQPAPLALGIAGAVVLVVAYVKLSQTCRLSPEENDTNDTIWWWLMAVVGCLTLGVALSSGLLAVV